MQSCVPECSSYSTALELFWSKRGRGEEEIKRFEEGR